jgi:serpin B
VKNLASWLRRLGGDSRPAAPQGPSTANAASIRIPSSALDAELDAIIAATKIRIVRDEALALLVQDNNAFAIALQGQLRVRGGNQFFSPFSIRTALAMPFVGANGETAAQMRAALHISMPVDALCAGNARLVGSLQKTDGACEMAIANSLWSQIGAPLEAAFVELITQHFGGSWNAVDFYQAAGAARAAINRWVSDRTNGKIRDVLAEDSPAADTRLMVVNVAYFKGEWLVPFDKDCTRDKPFFLQDGSKVRVPLMHETLYAGHCRAPGYQAITLPYEGTDLSLLVLLPDRKDGLENLETNLSAAMIEECLHEQGRSLIEIFLPRFKINWGPTDLAEVVAGLGMPLALTRSADFSGINGRAPPDNSALFISSVLHKAFVDVNEEGTEASAVSVLDMVCLGLPSRPATIPVFRADHPFLFAICDRHTGAIIFLGRMVDPRPQD